MPKKIEKSDIFRDNLKTKLTDPELKSLSKELAEKFITLEGLEKDKKGVVADYKARIEVIEAKLNSLSQKVSTTFEWREVDCQWEYDFKAGTKSMIRLDTKAIVNVVKITDADRQKLLGVKGVVDDKKDDKKKE
jgi:hypothetical protein